MAARLKYKNVRTNGFSSKREFARYQELKLLEKAGKIYLLKLQPRFPLRVNDQLICTYVGDFQYEENARGVVEDCKGYRTPIFKLKAKLMKAIYGITILET